MTSAGARIGEGRTAEIYTWGDHQVLKLFHTGVPPENVDYEARIAKIITKAGVSAPVFGGVVEVNGRRGILYEYIQGISMRRQMQENPWHLLRFARQFAEVHAAVHERSALELPSQHERIGQRISRAHRLSETSKSRLLSRLEALPEANNVCHGDFHPDNILVSPHSLMVIDWTDAKRGSPAADIARTTILLTESALPAHLNPAARLFFNGFRRLFYHAYMSRYAQIRPLALAEVQAWIPLQAAARLSEGIEEEEKRLLYLSNIEYQKE
jgi:uncharacterized protein (TIGR02172 family)